MCFSNFILIAGFASLVTAVPAAQTTQPPLLPSAQGGDSAAESFLSSCAFHASSFGSCVFPGLGPSYMANFFLIVTKQVDAKQPYRRCIMLSRRILNHFVQSNREQTGELDRHRRDIDRVTLMRSPESLEMLPPYWMKVLWIFLA